MTDKPKRGFSLMKPEKQRAIASQGGKKAHELGKAHQWDAEEASAAGKRSHELGRAHVFTPEEGREAGRKGGQSTAQRAASSKGGLAATQSKARKWLAQRQQEHGSDDDNSTATD